MALGSKAAANVTAGSQDFFKLFDIFGFSPTTSWSPPSPPMPKPKKERPKSAGCSYIIPSRSAVPSAPRNLSCGGQRRDRVSAGGERKCYRPEKTSSKRPGSDDHLFDWGFESDKTDGGTSSRGADAQKKPPFDDGVLGWNISLKMEGDRQNKATASQKYRKEMGFNDSFLGDALSCETDARTRTKQQSSGSRGAPVFDDIMIDWDSGFVEEDRVRSRKTPSSQKMSLFDDPWHALDLGMQNKHSSSSRSTSIFGSSMFDMDSGFEAEDCVRTKKTSSPPKMSMFDDAVFDLDLDMRGEDSTKTKKAPSSRRMFDDSTFDVDSDFEAKDRVRTKKTRRPPKTSMFDDPVFDLNMDMRGEDSTQTKKVSSSRRMFDDSTFDMDLGFEAEGCAQNKATRSKHNARSARSSRAQ